MCIVMVGTTEDYEIAVSISTAFLKLFYMMYFMGWMITSRILTLPNNVLDLHLLRLGPGGL